LAWWLLPLGVLGLDWGSKRWVLERFHPGDVHPVIPGFFNLTLGFNPGAIFGSFASFSPGLRQVFFLGTAVVALGYFGWEFGRSEMSRPQRVALGLILGGILGNSLDRWVHGHVVDFLDFVFWGWHYWTFNLADSAIVCGAILSGWSWIRSVRSGAA